VLEGWLLLNDCKHLQRACWKPKLRRACLFLQERTVRCWLLISALCLAGCNGIESECPCTLSLLGHRAVVQTGGPKPSPDPCPGSSFRALLKGDSRAGIRGAGTGAQGCHGFFLRHACVGSRRGSHPSRAGQGSTRAGLVGESISANSPSLCCR